MVPEDGGRGEREGQRGGCERSSSRRAEPESGALTQGLFEEGAKLCSRLVSVNMDWAVERHKGAVRDMCPLHAKAKVKAPSGL